MAHKARSYDDLSVGETFDTPSYLLTRAEIKHFAAAYDPQPMHLDDAAARETLFGQLVASGWQVAALSMRLMVEARPFGATPLIGLEGDNIRFQNPVLPDSRIRARLRITRLEPSSNPKRGFAYLSLETFNANNGQPLLSFESKTILPRM